MQSGRGRAGFWLGADWPALATAAALAAVTLWGLALRLRQAWADVRDIVVESAPDDAFYYFQIARNVTHGRGVTLDGDTVTTGFHPLWLIVTLPVFALDDRDLALHLALTLGAVMGAATTIVVFAIILRLLGNPRAALLGAAVFALHPVIVTHSVNGLETSVSLLTLSLLILWYVHLFQAPDARSIRGYVLLGVLAGLMTLARTDTAPVLAAVLVPLAWRERGPERWRKPLAAVLAASAVVLPWLAWSFVATGSIIQDSALAGGYVSRELYFAGHDDNFWDNARHGLDLVRDALTNELPSQFLVPMQTSPGLFWYAVAAFLALAVAIPTSRRGETLRAAGVACVPFIALLAMLVGEAGIRWFTRRWYYAPFGIGLAIGIGLAAHYLEGVIDDLRRRLPRRASTGSRQSIAAWSAYAVMYAVVALLCARQFAPSRFDGIHYTYPWQPDVLDATAWLDDNTDAEARIAAYNAGIPAYFGDRVVVNLDGVVNRDAFEALRDCRTRDYIRERDIDYVADSEPQFVITECALSLEDDLEIIETIGSVQPVLITRPQAGG